MSLLGEYNGVHLYDGREDDEKRKAQFAAALPAGARACAVLERCVNRLFRKPYLMVRHGYELEGRFFMLSRHWRRGVESFEALEFDEKFIVPPAKCPIDGCNEQVPASLVFCKAHRRLCPPLLRQKPEGLEIVKMTLAKRAAKKAAKNAKPETKLFSVPGEK